MSRIKGFFQASIIVSISSVIVSGELLQSHTGRCTVITDTMNEDSVHLVNENH